ncbi:LuxR C-terminal-related transcriptional regulator [Streptomyces mirabilis]|uniref:LuxR C-terminal-related transcriptional regulator n=1 Tax=Streptomyces mirabilis TaxID=68239 RepID=UPI0037FD6CA6
MTETRKKPGPHPQEAQILALIAQGLNNAAIAERLFCGPRAVRKVRENNDLPPASRNSWRLPHPKEKEIRRLLAEDLTDAEIHRRTGASPETIATRRKELRIGRAPMPKPKARPHPREAEILVELRAGGTNNGIARKLGVDKVAVGRIRGDHRIPNTYERKRAEQPTLEQRWQELARTVTGGHAEWTGKRSTPSNTPILRHLGSWYSPAAIAFRMRTGREPHGQVRAECDFPQCVAPACVEDEPGRQALRRHLRALQGLGPVPDTCPGGHEQAVDGRLDASLHAYCEGCKRDKARAKKQARTAT